MTSEENRRAKLLAVGSMVVLTICLRQKGSAESRPVGAADEETGG